MAVTISGTDGVGLVTSDALPFLAGQVCFFAQSSAPDGFLKCNGATVSRTTYDVLFAAIGTTYGAGDGSTTFALPDLRGEFLRCLDDGRGVDTSRSLGSAQSGANEEHGHFIGTGGFTASITAAGTGAAPASLNVTGYNNGMISTYRYGQGNYSVRPDDASALKGYNDGTEARPRNIALLACIKY